MVFGHGTGQLGAPFIIIKCSAKGTDYSRTTVLQNLVKDAINGTDPDLAFYHRKWTLYTWRRDIYMKQKNGEMGYTTFTIPYLRSSSGAIITVQEKVPLVAPAVPHAVRR